MLPCRVSAMMMVAAAIALWPQDALGQCQPQWSNPFSPGGLDNLVYALTIFDPDGGGSGSPALYAGGNFTLAGGITANRAAKWNGSAWSQVGSGMNSTVFALTVLDADGSGPNPGTLYAGGNFITSGPVTVHYIAQLNAAGSAWLSVGGGMNDVVHALAVFGTPPALYAAGRFTIAGTTAANHVAKWSGTAWSPLGTGTDDVVYALTVYDPDGSGPLPAALYAAGAFTLAGDLDANHVAKWNGTAWSPLAPDPSHNGVNDQAMCLAVFDPDGSGPNLPGLYIGGYFTRAGGLNAPRIARWNGTSWSAVGGGFDGAVFALTVFDQDGTGSGSPALYAGGVFTTADGNGAERVAKWDGTSWSALGSGVNEQVRALVSFDDNVSPGVPALYVGGNFTSAGGLAVERVARWACPPGTPPTITQQPQSHARCVGKSVTFTVTATGSPPLQYQWRKDGQNIQNATQTSYTINPVALADAGVYDVVVSNGVGSVTSDPATLTVVTCLVGDLNCNGLVNNFDIGPFVLVLTSTPPNYPEYYAEYPDCDHMLADIDGNGVVNNFDIGPFVALLIGP